MKYIFFLFIIIVSPKLFSQKQVLIHNSEETVYPIQQEYLNLSNELANLKDFFKNKNIVGMGEATHGTHEFFELKSQMFRFLVEQCGYRVFAIEASYGAELYLNDYVKKGEGTIEGVMKYLDWPWGTQEVKNLVEWIKGYNQDKLDSEKVSFYGFDMQNITPTMTYLNHFFSADSAEFSKAFRAITPLVTTHTETEIFAQIRQNPTEITDSLKHISSKLFQWMTANKSVLTAKYSLKQYEVISLCVENFNQSVLNVSGERLSYHYRDSCMAHNILKIQSLENAKVFVWAHNGHVCLEYKKTLTMGTFIKQAMKERYYAIGFVFDHGSFLAFKGPNTIPGAVIKFLFARKKLYKGLIACSVAHNSKNSLTNELQKTNLPSFFIDLQSTSNPLFTTFQYYYDIGASYMNSRRSSVSMIAKKEFDGLIYVNVSNCTQLMNW